MSAISAEAREHYVLTGRIMATREKAVLFAHEKKEFWIPVSQILRKRTRWWWFGNVELTLTAWFAETKGMV